MMMELSLGRAGRSTFPGAFRNLQNKNVRFRWDFPAYLLFSGNMFLLMFYTVISRLRLLLRSREIQDDGRRAMPGIL